MHMKAFILAAGRGERMRPLTDHCPKPLLSVGNKPLIVWHLEKLSQITQINQVVINHAWLGHQIEATLGNGSPWNKKITYSAEGQRGLETAGGIRYALEQLGTEPFLVINGDIFTDYPFENLIKYYNHSLSDKSDKKERWRASLVVVPNPPHHPEGDFTVNGQSYTFSGIGLYDFRLFESLPYEQPAKLGPLLKTQLTQDPTSIDFFIYTGKWYDIGTPERLTAINHVLNSSSLESK